MLNFGLFLWLREIYMRDPCVITCKHCAFNAFSPLLFACFNFCLIIESVPTNSPPLTLLLALTEVSRVSNIFFPYVDILKAERQGPASLGGSCVATWEQEEMGRIKYSVITVKHAMLVDMRSAGPFLSLASLFLLFSQHSSRIYWERLGYSLRALFYCSLSQYFTSCIGRILNNISY